MSHPRHPSAGEFRVKITRCQPLYGRPNTPMYLPTRYTLAVSTRINRNASMSMCYLQLIEELWSEQQQSTYVFCRFPPSCDVTVTFDRLLQDVRALLIAMRAVRGLGPPFRFPLLFFSLVLIRWKQSTATAKFVCAPCFPLKWVCFALSVPALVAMDIIHD